MRMYLCRVRGKQGVYHRRLTATGRQVVTTTDIGEAFLSSSESEMQELAQSFPELEVCMVNISEPAVVLADPKSKLLNLTSDRDGTGMGELKALQNELVAVLEKLNRRRPIQFLDFESEYVYNFLRLRECSDEDRLFIEVSGRYDNLPAHAKYPITDGRGHPISPSVEFSEPVAE